MNKSKKRKPLAVYVHWGFCRRKCPYCDFMSRKLPTSINYAEWLKEYKRALDFYLLSADSRDFYLSSVYFGGGTPSLLPSSFIEDLLAYISSRIKPTAETEITLEANPYKLTRTHLLALKEAGINRLSLGVQSFNDEELKFLGRLHNAKEATNALEATANIFSNFSFDLIYALPEQSPDSWEKSLHHAFAFNPTHLSCYQLTIEEPSLFFKQGIVPMEEEKAIILYNLTNELTTAHSLPAYEISNHAKTGFESHHNLSYWQYEDFIGIGPSACGRITIQDKIFATKEKTSPFLWLRSKNKTIEFNSLSQIEVNEEKILMGLRLRKGIKKDLLNNISIVTKLLDEGYLQKGQDDFIFATDKGIPILNQLILSLI